MYAPGHEEQPAQPVHVHFNVHVWLFDAHQLLHNAAVVVVVVVLEQEEHPAQRDQMHFVAHGLELGAHQLSHVVAVLIVVAVVVGVVVVTVSAMGGGNAAHNDAVQSPKPANSNNPPLSLPRTLTEGETDTHRERGGGDSHTHTKR